jgi:hypothetical protein
MIKWRDIKSQSIRICIRKRSAVIFLVAPDTAGRQNKTLCSTWFSNWMVEDKKRLSFETGDNKTGTCLRASGSSLRFSDCVPRKLVVPQLPNSARSYRGEHRDQSVLPVAIQSISASDNSVVILLITLRCVLGMKTT